MTTSTTDGRWQPRNPAYEQTVRDAFAAQTAMAHIGAELAFIAPGAVHITLPCHDRVMSHLPPIVHGGTIGMIADSAMGFAAMTLAAEGSAGVTAEYKINMLSPAVGDHLLARGTVVKAGSRLTVAQADIVVVTNSGEKPGEKLVATALGTLIAL